MSDLEIEIDLDILSQNDSGFSEVKEFYDFFVSLLNCLRNISMYDIKIRGQYLEYWINNPTNKFKESLDEQITNVSKKIAKNQEEYSKLTLELESLFDQKKPRCLSEFEWK